jgi:flagellar basal-body rod modification protein FlgD
MGKDDFLSLLVTQLQYQDPLEPMDATQFTTQLAQFSELEQMQNVNGQLGYLQLYMASLNNAQAVNFIGKEVVALGNAVYLDEEEEQLNLHYELEDESTHVLVSICDENGQLVRVLGVGAQDSGEHTLTWDGRDDSGSRLTPGTYTFSVTAQDADGNEIAARTYRSGTVTGVTFEDQITYLLLGDEKVAIGEVLRVGSEVSEEESSGSGAAEFLMGVAAVLSRAAPLATLIAG